MGQDDSRKGGGMPVLNWKMSYAARRLWIPNIPLILAEPSSHVISNSWSENGLDGTDTEPFLYHTTTGISANSGFYLWVTTRTKLAPHILPKWREDIFYAMQDPIAQFLCILVLCGSAKNRSNLFLCNIFFGGKPKNRHIPHNHV